MAKYTYDYACGHGSETVQLFGPGKERERKLVWYAENKVCPECYKLKMKNEDAIAEKKAHLVLVPGLTPIIAIEIEGQIEENKKSLYELGYNWSDSSRGGLFGYLSFKAPKRVMKLYKRIETSKGMDHASAETGSWISEQQKELSKLGYGLTNDLNAIDMDWVARKCVEEQDKKDKIDAWLADNPKPEKSRIEEVVGAGRFNGKIYGNKGGYNYYVDGKKHTATDAEADEFAQSTKREKEFEKFRGTL